MSGTKKTYAIIGGGSWHDASVDLLDVPGDVNLDEEKIKWRAWYEREYMPLDIAKRNNKPFVKYLSFPEWLIEKCGAIKSEVVEEYYG